MKLGNLIAVSGLVILLTRIIWLAMPEVSGLVIFLLVCISFLAIFFLRKIYRQEVASREKQRKFIRHYEFSEGLKQKFTKKHSSLEDQQITLVFNALREYFHLCYEAGTSMVSMPSQVVDDAWHEFILFTQDYQAFCQQAFGRFLHHTPAEAMNGQNQAQKGIKLAWRLACFREQINPRQPSKLPLIFAIDSLLKIENGFYYELNCVTKKNQENLSENLHIYCATDIGCAAGWGGNDGCDDSSHSDNSSDGCSLNSCSGGCGGGCGGGD